MIATSRGVPPDGPARPIVMRGAPYERGRMFGEAASARIQGFVRARWSIIDRGGRANDVARRLLGEYEEAIARWAPELHEEMRGVAFGAGISVADAVLIQAHREVTEAARGEAAGCTLIACGAGPIGAFVAQTVDLDGSLRELGAVLSVEPDGAGVPRAALFTLVGLLGYLGVNSAGLAVGINMVVSDGWRPALPPYLLVRLLLEQTSIDGAIGVLERVPRSSSRTLTLCDDRRAVCVETTPTQMRLLSAYPVVHTNHFLHPDLLAEERSHVMSRRSSKARLKRIEKLACPGGPREVDEIFGWLADHEGTVAICDHGVGRAGRTETIAAVAMVPAQRALVVRSGPPCHGIEARYLAS